jgi:hypothetical protein
MLKLVLKLHLNLRKLNLPLLLVEGLIITPLDPSSRSFQIHMYILVFYYILCSFNDDTYMSTMGVGSNNSHWSQTNEVHEDDHEFEVDEDGEGIVDAPKGRAGNYTMDEDILLCNTWLHVSMDANVGGDQSRDTYWVRMKEHFDIHNKSGIDCTDRSLCSRWSTINKDCQRWAAALKAADTINPSYHERHGRHEFWVSHGRHGSTSG